MLHDRRENHRADCDAVRRYADYHASAPALWPEAAARIAEALDAALGNPSSVHEEGRRARKWLREARLAVAALVGASDDEVVFTSGVSESLALGVRGLALASPHRMLVSSAFEHRALLGALQGLEGYTLRLSTALGLPPEASPTPAALLATHLVQHELGTISDLDVWIAASGETPLLIDAAQGAAWAKEAWARPAVTALALGGHKIGGPSGVGVLLVRRGAPFVAILRGGPQEHGLRAGTEATALIAGFAEALRQTLRRADETQAKLAGLGAAFEARIGQVAGARIYVADRPRAPGITAAGIVGVPARRLVERLSARGFAIGSGAACASFSNEPSDTMRALGVSRERALETFRVSFGWQHTPEDAITLAEVIAQEAAHLRGEGHF